MVLKNNVCLSILFYLFNAIFFFINVLFILGKTTLNRSTNNAQQSIVKRRVCILLSIFLFLFVLF